MTRQGFYRLLRKVTKERRLKWTIKRGKIRARNYIDSCPISVCHFNGVRHSREYMEVALALRLPDRPARDIAIAADCRLNQLPGDNRTVRRSLLRACGLEGHRYA